MVTNITAAFGYIIFVVVCVHWSDVISLVLCCHYTTAMSSKFPFISCFFLFFTFPSLLSAVLTLMYLSQELYLCIFICHFIPRRSLMILDSTHWTLFLLFLFKTEVGSDLLSSGTWSACSASKPCKSLDREQQNLWTYNISSSLKNIWENLTLWRHRPQNLAKLCFKN